MRTAIPKRSMSPKRTIYLIAKLTASPVPQAPLARRPVLKARTNDVKLRGVDSKTGMRPTMWNATMSPPTIATATPLAIS